MKKSELIIRMETDCKIRGNAHRNRFTKYRNLHVRIGLPAALLATAAGSLATISADEAALASHYSGLEIAGLICSWSVALFTAASTFLRPLETSQGHKEKAGAYDVLLGQIGRAVEYLKEDELRKEIEAIDSKIDDLKKAEPFLSDKILRTSKISLIKAGELSETNNTYKNEG